MYNYKNSKSNIINILKSKTPIEENSIGFLNTNDLKAVYSQSKRTGELLALAYCKQYLIPAKIVRLFHVYGEKEELNNGTFLSDFLNDVLQKRNIEIEGDGSEIRNLCYVDDAIAGIFYALFKGVNGEAYNVGSHENNCTIKEIAEHLSNIAGGFGVDIQVVIKNKKKKTFGDKLINAQIPSTDKIAQLGWTEEYSNIQLALKKVVSSYLMNELEG